MDRPLIRFAAMIGAALAMAGAVTADPRHEQRGGSSMGSYGGGRALQGGYYRPQGGPAGGYYRSQGAPPPGGYYRPQSAPYSEPNRTAPSAYPYGYGERPANSLGADWREQQEEARSGVRMGQMAPLGQVIRGIGSRSAGRPLDAGIEYQGSRAVYRVRWLTANGRRVDYMVDAATGAIISEH